MELEEIGYSVAGGVATITLNRPDALNAFTARMVSELLAAASTRSTGTTT